MSKNVTRRACATGGLAMLFKKNETIVLIGKGLRRQSEEIIHEPLPHRLVDLIRHLNEKEPKRSDAPSQTRS